MRKFLSDPPLSSESITERGHHRTRERAPDHAPCHPLHLSIRLRTISLLNASGVSIALGCEKYNIFILWWETLAKVCREITSRFNQGLLRGSMSPGPRQRSKGDREGEREKETDNRHIQLRTRAELSKAAAVMAAAGRERSKNKRLGRDRNHACLGGLGACFSHPLTLLHSLDNPGLGSTSTTTRRMPMLPTHTWRR